MGAYAATSWCLMLISAFFTFDESPNRFHLVFQVTLAAACGIIFLFQVLSRDNGSVDSSTAHLGVVTPPMLANLVESIEQRVILSGDNPVLAVNLKRFREFLKYSLSSGENTLTPEYTLFAGEVIQLCKSSNQPNLDEVSSLHETAKRFSESFKSS
jgi:hypothetical protein